MTQNNYDLDASAIRIANQNNGKYVLDKQSSIKRKKAKKLKLVNKGRFIFSVGIVTLCISLYAFNISGKSIKPNDIPYTAQVEYVEEVNDSDMNMSITEQLINKYSNIYGLKYETVSSAYAKNKEYFKSVNYLKTSGFENYNEEVEILTFIRHLYQKPEEFGYTKDIIKNYNYVQNNNINEEQTVKYVSSLLGVDPVLALAIEYQESSSNGERYNSELYNVYNNPAGLINPGTGSYWEFPSKEAGIIEHIYQLKKNYIDKGLTTPKQIKETYAPDYAENDPNNYNLYWVNNVNSIMEEIRNNPNIFDEKNVTK